MTPPPPPTFKVALVEQLFQSAWAANVTAAAETIGSDSSDEEEMFDSAPLITAAAAASRVRKIHADALKLSTEMLRLFVVEAVRRAQMEAMVDDSEHVEPLHVEQNNCIQRDSRGVVRKSGVESQDDYHGLQNDPDQSP
uniref:Centromere protein X n=1 Tax=Hyaloperonospora arabidopsidis (strain Emoy2) TaxID=559515 RepID=M4BH85_HYAAE